MAKFTNLTTLLLLCLFLALLSISKAEKVYQYIAQCQKRVAQNPDLPLQMMCLVPGQNQPQSYPTIALQSVPDKCEQTQSGFYTVEQYKAIQQDIRNLEPDVGPFVGQNFPFKSTGYWCDESGIPTQTQFDNVTVYIGTCMYGQSNQIHIHCLAKVQPIKIRSSPKVEQAPAAQTEDSSPGFLTTLQTIILFPFFLLFCWILPFLGTIFSKNQHEKWITFWILNMVIQFLMVPVLELFFYNPMILIIRIITSIALVKFVKHSLVQTLLNYVDLVHGLVKTEYNKLKEKAVAMSEQFFGK